MLQKRDNLKLQVINYILSGNGKSIRGIFNTSIQFEKGHVSFVELSINGLVRYFLKVDLVKSHISYIKKRNDPPGSRFILDTDFIIK